MSRPAYSKAFAERIAAGEVTNLVVLALAWEDGKLLADRPGVVRLVIAADADVADLDLSMVRGFDVLILEADDALFYGACRLALAFGAASVWGEFDDGVWRLASCISHPGVVAIDRVRDADALLKVLPVRRDVGLLCGSGIYKAPQFREARLLTMGQIFGPAFEARMRAKVAA